MKNYVIREEEQQPSIVQEAGAHYFSSSIHTLLSDRPLQAHDSIIRGITYEVFEQLQHKIDISEEKWAEILCLSVKSLQRYKKDIDFRFKPIHTEKILEISEVVVLGLRVFDNDSKKFNEWLVTTSFVLGNHKPIDLISDSYGKEMVMQELNNIEQGIFV